MQKQVLIVEDDRLLALNLAQILQQNKKLQVTTADTLINARRKFNLDFNLVILDRKLPDGDGLELIKYFQDQNEEVNFLILSQLSQIQEREASYLAGTDDYLAKPFSKVEFLQRVDRLLNFKRKISQKPCKITNDFVLFSEEKKLLVDQKEVKLTKNETILLEVLSQNRNFVIKREIILESLGENEDFVSTDALNSLVYRLRQKMGRFKDCLKTFYDLGYQLKIVNSPIKQISRI